MQRFQLVLRNVLFPQLLFAHKKMYATQKQQQQLFLHTLALHNYVARRTASTATTTTKTNQNRQLQKITLIAQNHARSVTTLEEAQKLAKRRELHLLRLEEADVKTGRPMYKLVTAAEMFADESSLADSSTSSPNASANKNKKSEKSLTIGTRITDHDLSSRLKNIAKWLAKRHEVRILIQASGGGDDANTERIVKAIEHVIKDPLVIGRIVQKRSKGAVTKFNILPVATIEPSAEL